MHVHPTTETSAGHGFEDTDLTFIETENFRKVLSKEKGHLR